MVMPLDILMIFIIIIILIKQINVLVPNMKKSLFRSISNSSINCGSIVYSSSSINSLTNVLVIAAAVVAEMNVVDNISVYCVLLLLFMLSSRSCTERGTLHSFELSIFENAIICSLHRAFSKQVMLVHIYMIFGS